MDSIIQALTTHFGWGAVGMGIVAAWFAKMELKNQEKRLDKMESTAAGALTKDDFRDFAQDIKTNLLALNTRIDRVLEKQ